MSDFARLLEIGRAEAAPPVNDDAPYVAGEGVVGAMLTCTMGNWQGDPLDYGYLWRRDGANANGWGASYSVTAEDAGCTIDCVVTASNLGGSTASPPSNPVVVSATQTAAAPAPPTNPQRRFR